MKKLTSADLSRRSFLAYSTMIGLAGTSFPGMAAAALINDPTANLGPAVALAIRNVAQQGANDVFPHSPEVHALRADAELRWRVMDRVADIIARGRFDPNDFSSPEYLEVPKRFYDERRICAVIEPFETITYLALAILAAPAIEQRKVPATDGIVFSHRFAPSRGFLFDRRYNYTSFVEARRQFSRRARFAVASDIAAFFPTLSPRLVRSSLERVGVAASLSDFITDLVDFWSRSPGVGLPVGPNASRIIAESALVPIDDTLRSKGVNFIRFVDDFCLFAQSEAEARRSLEMLQDTLQSYDLSLNASKTSIIDLMDSRRHQSEFYRTAPEVQRMARKHSGQNSKNKMIQKFRPATEKELARIMQNETNIDLTKLLSGERAPAWVVRRSIRIAIYRKQEDVLVALPEIIARYPEFGRYIVSALAQCVDWIPAPIRTIVSSHLSNMLFDTPPFVQISLLGLFGQPKYAERPALVRFARQSLEQGGGGIRLRIALASLARTGGIPIDIIEMAARGEPAVARELLVSCAISPVCDQLSKPNPTDPFAVRFWERIAESPGAQAAV
jgi:hypothetical protein